MIRLESEHSLPFPREMVWPIVSKTDWLNRALGLPPVQYDIQPEKHGGSVIKARASVAGLEMRWEEIPFEWLEPEFYRVRRRFETGPFVEIRTGVDLQGPGDRETQLLAWSELTPRNALGTFLARRLLGRKVRRGMETVISQLKAHLGGQVAVALPNLRVHPVQEPVLQRRLEKLRRSDLSPDLVERLASLLRDSPDVELSHIRPLAIARRWGHDPWQILTLFLHATHSGLLEFRWEVLCPHCRSERSSSPNSLGAVKRVGRCEVCQIDFDAEFDKSVELKFAVHPAIRRREEQTFCLAGPGGTPHVVSQTLIEPYAEREWKLPGCNDPLLLHSPQVKNRRVLHLAHGAPVISCEVADFVIEQIPGSGDASVARVRNPNAFPVVLSLEQMTWSEDILTAARVTGWQEFRELFSTEVISPKEEVIVGRQVVVFTDLRGSTAMYRGIGDGPAYALVRDHFGIITDAVSAHHGAVVKTIGDAVMAAFGRVDESLEAIAAMHRNLAASRVDKAGELALKTSLQAGPCLAVNANDRIDFFGTTINLAARMVGCCRGGDLIVSDELFHQAELKAFLETIPRPAEPLEIKFRGFDAPRRVWRIQLIEGPAS